MTAGVSMAVMAPLFQLETKVSILVATPVQKTRLCACCLVGDGDLIVEPPPSLSQVSGNLEIESAQGTLPCILYNLTDTNG